jgi:hypothetical protein
MGIPSKGSLLPDLTGKVNQSSGPSRGVVASKRVVVETFETPHLSNQIYTPNGPQNEESSIPSQDCKVTCKVVSKGQSCVSRQGVSKEVARKDLVPRQEGICKEGVTCKGSYKVSL